jgi:hypothetical protein
MAPVGFALSQQWRTELRRYENEGNDEGFPQSNRAAEHAQKGDGKFKSIGYYEVPAGRRQPGADWNASATAKQRRMPRSGESWHLEFTGATRRREIADLRSAWNAIL